jgi:hypothetical protein
MDMDRILRLPQDQVAPDTKICLFIAVLIARTIIYPITRWLFASGIIHEDSVIVFNAQQTIVYLQHIGLTSLDNFLWLLWVGCIQMSTIQVFCLNLLSTDLTMLDPDVLRILYINIRHLVIIQQQAFLFLARYDDMITHDTPVDLETYIDMFRQCGNLLIQVVNRLEDRLGIVSNVINSFNEL